MDEVELLNEQEIIKRIDKSKVEPIEIELHQQLESTNAHLMRQPVSELTKVCLAETQTGGRGRYGKSWYSPSGANIYLSISHPMKMPLTEISGLSLVIGLSLAKTLQSYCSDEITVKWPNDLMVDAKKLSGILIEIKNNPGNPPQIIIGIGINVTMSESHIEAITQPWTSLKQCNPLGSLSRNHIIADVLSRMLDEITLFENSGFKVYSKQWNNLDRWIGKEVDLIMGKDIMTGIHKGVDFNGALLLERDGKITAYSSGQVSLRRTNHAIAD